MGKAVEITGQKYGRLLVLRRVGTAFVSASKKTGKRHSVSTWEVRCDCGIVKTIKADAFYRIRSCGCLKREQMTLPNGVAAKNRVLNYYRQSARKKGHLWQISKAQFEILTQQPCFYCNTPPRTEAKSYYNSGSFLYNGLDRQDNTKGYIDGNVVPCCGVCNKMKLALSVEEFLSHIHRISAAQASKLGNA